MAYIYNIPFINYFITKISALLGHEQKTAHAERSIHPIVHQYHISRSIGAFLVFVVWLSLFYNSANVFMWICILSYGLIWPHVAFAIAKQHKTPKKAELNNLLFDSLISGVWIGLWSYSLWPSLPLIVGVGCMNILTGGVKFLLRGYVVLALGAVLMGLITGFDVQLESTTLVSFVSAMGTLIFTMMMGYMAYAQTKVLISLKKDLRDKKEGLEGLAAKLAKYLSPQVYNSIFSGEKEVKVETYRKKLTVFFSDIEGFTALTESMESEELTKLLNTYLNEMSNIAIKHGGTIDKYIGDSIMIFFGDPKTRGVKEDALACVTMALEMRQCMDRLRTEWNAQGISKPLRIRIGINTGFCTVGNFGSEDRLDYTIIGNQVNLASRLETNAETDEILISNETYLLIKDTIKCGKKDLIEVKGVAHPVQTYKVIDFVKNLITGTNIIKNSHDGFKVKVNLSRTSRAAAVKSLKRVLAELE